MPGSVDRIARSLLRVAEHGMIEVFRIDPCPLNRSLRRHRAQFLRRVILDLPAIASKGRARAADNGNVSRFQHESCLGKEMAGQKPTCEFNRAAVSSQLSALSFWLIGMEAGFGASKKVNPPAFGFSRRLGGEKGYATAADAANCGA